MSNIELFGNKKTLIKFFFSHLDKKAAKCFQHIYNKSSSSRFVHDGHSCKIFQNIYQSFFFLLFLLMLRRQYLLFIYILDQILFHYFSVFVLYKIFLESLIISINELSFFSTRKCDFDLIYLLDTIHFRAYQLE